MVSVIIPVYNTEAYLDECIRSVVNQTYKELEIILINDGSTDGSGEICRKWKGQDPRITYIEKENEGQGNARNLGIGLASGEYLIFVDSDDYLDRDLIRKVRSRIQEEEADICVYAHYGVGDELYETPLRFTLKGGDRVENNPHLLSHMMPVLCDKMFSLRLIKQVGIRMGNRICEDLVFNARLYVRAGNICMVNAPLYYYRYKREGNMSTCYDRYPEVVESIEELHEIFHRDGLFERYWRELYQISFTMFKDILFRIRKREDLQVPLQVKDRYPRFLDAFNQCLARLYRGRLSVEMQTKGYLLVGSYNLRVIIHRLLLEEDFLREDYGSSSIVSLMSKGSGGRMDELSGGFKNPYRKRCVEQDILKEFANRRRREGIDYLVADLLDEIWDLIELGDGSYITESPFLREIHPEGLDGLRRIPFLCGERRRLFGEYVTIFCRKVREMGIPVIVVKNFLCERHSAYYDVCVKDDRFDHWERIREINRELEWCYEQLCANLPEAVVADSSDFKELVFTHEEFPFGCEPIYYNEGYYQRMAVAISEGVYCRGKHVRLPET